MEFDWSEDERIFRSDIRTFLDQEVPARWREHPVQLHFGPDDRARVVAFNGRLGERGWLTPHWPQQHGGNEASPWQHVILGEEMWSIGEPRGPQYMSVNWIGPAIMAWGTDAQKEEHLSRISRGEAFWCQGFSEPDAGTDLASLRTAAVLDGDEYIVNGQKIWTSHTQLAEWCFLLVRTDTEAERHKGITVLLVPMSTPGIEVRPIVNLAEKAAFAELFFTDVRVPVANRLGPENGGWDIVRSALQFERVGSPRWERASRVLDAVAQWAQKNGRFDEPRTQHLLGAAKASCEASRFLAYSVIDERAKQLPASPQAYVARAAMVRAERAVAEAAMEIMGSEALDDESLAAQNFYGAMTAGLAAGSYEVQLNLIAGLVLGLPEALIMDFALSNEQQQLTDAVATLLTRRAGPARARAVGPDGHDDALLQAFDEAGFLDVAGDPSAGPLSAELITEAVSAAHGRINIGVRSLVAPALLGSSAPLRTAVAASGPDTLVRYGQHADVVLVLDGDLARVIEGPDSSPVPSRFGVPLARVDTRGGRSLGPGTGPVLLAWWQVALAAEMTGAMSSALTLTVGYLSSRKQFGKPLASLQALQHRLADAHIWVEGARWLARTAAWHGPDPARAAAAVGYAADAARIISADMHQLSGAIGFTLEYDLQLSTTRLHSMRLELGGTDVHYRALARASWS